MLIWPLYLQVITYTRQGWSTAWVPLLFLSLLDRALSVICWIKITEQQQKKGHLRAPSFSPRVSINLWRGRRMMRELNPINKREATPPAETPEMNHKAHAFLSFTVPHWLKKNTIWKPSGRLVWGHAIRLGNYCGGAGWDVGGGLMLHNNTCFILSAMQETSFLPEFWKQTAHWNRLPFCWITQRLLGRKQKETNDLWVFPISLPSHIKHSVTNRCCCRGKSFFIVIVAEIQTLFYEANFTLKPGIPSKWTN